MAGDPADIGGTPVHIVFLDIEDVAMRGGNAHEIPGGSVHDALGFSRGAAGIEDKKHVFRIHGLGGALIGGRIGGFVPPDVPPRLHGSFSGVANPADHHDIMNRGRAL